MSFSWRAFEQGKFVYISWHVFDLLRILLGEPNNMFGKSVFAYNYITDFLCRLVGPKFKLLNFLCRLCICKYIQMSSFVSTQLPQSSVHLSLLMIFQINASISPQIRPQSALHNQEKKVPFLINLICQLKESLCPQLRQWDRG